MTGVGELITPTGVLVMDAETMRMDREAWLAARRAGAAVPWCGPWSPERYRRMAMAIGSSEVPSILDLDGVDTPAHVYAAKVHGVRPEVNVQMRFGSRFEHVIADMWTEDNRSVTDEIGLVRHVDKPWRQSTIDRRVRECPVVKGLRDGCLLEIKNVGYNSAEKWKRNVPDRVLAQMLHQLYVTGYDHAHYACNLANNALLQGIVWAGRETELTAYVIGEVDAFRERHLIPGVEPEWNVMNKPDKMLALDRMLHPVRAGEIGINDIGEVMEYARLAREAADADAALKAAKARLVQLAEGAEVVLFGDQRAYQYGGEGAQQSRTKVDLDKLAERHPVAYADPEVVTQTVGPVLRLASAFKVKKTRRTET